MQTHVSMAIKSQIYSADGKLQKDGPWRKNLVLDTGLNGMAFDSSHTNDGDCAQSFTYCHIGGGTNPTSFASGAITFTQALNAVIASAPFFTSAMVGGILKYGTGSGGAEYYITAFTDSLHVTVDTSATVTALVGTVWQVQATTLQTELFRTNTYRTLGGDNFTTCSSPTCVMQRTFQFSVQGSPYTVNEIGWGAQNNTTVGGRIVLGSSDVVPTTSFYVVILQLTITYAPAAPAASGNVGTNIDTTGTAMMEFFDVDRVDASGASLNAGTISQKGPHIGINMCNANYTQRSTIGNTSTLTWPTQTVIGNVAAVAWTFATTRGLCTATGSSSASFGSTFTIYGVGIVNFSTGLPAFDIKFTTPVVVAAGVFAPTIVFSCLYSRTLTN